jgi:hypothetical protein
MTSGNRMAVEIALGVVLGGIALGATADSELLHTEPWLMFGSSFESGAIFDGEDWNFSGNELTVTREKARAGDYAVKSYLHRYDSHTSYRTELRAKAPPPVKGQDTWYGFSIYLPAPFERDEIGETLTQWHATSDPGEQNLNPPIALKVKDGSWGLFVRSNPFQPTVKSRQHQDSYKFGSLDTNEWTDWVFRIRWSYDNDGIVQVWKNGKQVLNRTGPNCYNDKVMPHFRIGIYKSQWRSKVGDVTERTVYHDEVRIAGKNGSYSVVAPKGGR